MQGDLKMAASLDYEKDGLILDNFEDIKSKLANKFENDEFDVKGTPVSIEKTVEIISSFMNGNKEYGYIVIGVQETTDAINKQSKKANVNDIKFVEFPIKITTQKKGEAAKQRDNFEDYVIAIKSYFEKNTAPKINLDKYLEIKMILANDSKGNEGNIILIKVKRCHEKLIQINQGRCFYGRLPKKGAYDYESASMNSKQIEERMKDRQFNKHNLETPLYFESTPAIPELTILFNLIYLDQYTETESLLRKMPILTQMTDSVGSNALLIATSCQREDIVDLLLGTYNMSLYHRNEEGDTPLLIAARLENLKLVKKSPFFIYDRDISGNNIFMILFINAGERNEDSLTWVNQQELIRYLISECKHSFSNFRSYDGIDILREVLLETIIQKLDKKFISLLLSEHTYNPHEIELALETAKSFNNVEAGKILEEKLSQIYPGSLPSSLSLASNWAGFHPNIISLKRQRSKEDMDAPQHTIYESSDSGPHP